MSPARWWWARRCATSRSPTAPRCAPPCPRWPHWPAASATRMCGTGERSAARSPTTTRRPTTRRPCWPAAPQIVTDRRGIAADDFFQGMFTTALGPDELITAIRFAIPKQAAYEKFAQAASGYAMTGVFVARFDDGVRVAVTGAAPCVFRWAEAEDGAVAALRTRRGRVDPPAGRRPEHRPARACRLPGEPGARDAHARARAPCACDWLACAADRPARAAGRPAEPPKDPPCRSN